VGQKFCQFSKNNEINDRTLSFWRVRTEYNNCIYRKLAEISALDRVKRLDILPIFREFNDVRKIGRNLAENGFLYPQTSHTVSKHKFQDLQHNLS
jgi:hypothetical protein